MKQEEDKFTGLPENAFRELKPGEVYNILNLFCYFCKQNVFPYSTR